MSQLPTSPGGKRKPSLKLALETVNEVSNDQTEVSESAMKSPKPYGGFDMTMPTPRTAVPRPPKTPRIIDEGVKKFRHFDTKMNGLDSELLRFANNVRPLGSSVNLIRSSYALRKSLHQIRHLFRVNASEIFPAFVENEEPTSLEPIVLRKRYRAMRDPLNLVKVPNRMVESKKGLAPDLERFPRQLGKLAQEMISFLHFLHDIPEFTDETLTHRIHAAHADVKYWEFSFSEHKGKFQTAAVQRQVNNLCNELQGHIENMTEALKAFQKDGINYIKSAQTQAQTGFQNLSTIATFFSAMTATTLQFSWQEKGVLYDAVNGLWIGSLVLSVASAIHSQLVYQWRAAMYRSPTNTLPWLVTTWLTKTPLLFLVFSVLLFSSGLVTWTYASQQKLAVSISTTCIAFIALLALPITLLMWTAFEYWRYTKPTVIEQDLQEDDDDEEREEGGATELTNEKVQSIRSTLLQAYSWILNVLKKGMQESPASAQDLEQGSLTKEDPSSNGKSKDVAINRSSAEPSTELYPHPNIRGFGDPSNDEDPNKAAPLNQLDTGNESHLMTDAGQLTMDPMPIEEQSGPSQQPEGSSPAENPSLDQPEALHSPNWLANDIPNSNPVPMPRKVDHSKFAPANNPLRRSYWANIDRRSYFGRHNTSYEDTVNPSELAKIGQILREFSTSKPLSDEHKSSISHLQFSPDGLYLASGSSDHTAVIWKLEGEQGEIRYKHHVKLEHKSESVRQVAWSPTQSRRVLSRSSNIINVWTAETPNTPIEIKTDETIQAVTWRPDGESFFVLEDSQIHLIEITENVKKDTNLFELTGLKIQNMTLTPDGKHMILIAAVPKPENEEYKWSKCKLEKRIVAYNMEEKMIENHSPIMDKARNLAISRDGRSLLVSYEDKHPPELWAVFGGENGVGLDITLHYACDGDEVVEFTGEAYYGGEKDEFVICATKNGTIHIWDTTSGYLLHILQAPHIRGDRTRVTGIAWRNTSTAALASGHGDGAIFVWQANPQERPPPVPKTPIRRQPSPS